ncbi:hypothetical protein GGU10DRAFT_375436 [Lentinula aff. detonsa]|uniref:Uncharacterized protein n=1 Tax=Lentinula aff. detonsa TaxID=2804958 RepID=A0AA38KAB3_9AGAR|nr:hypothetical protein GGU10DRAFT_375436 [Lentinula aff. detonsa]
MASKQPPQTDVAEGTIETDVVAVQVVAGPSSMLFPTLREEGSPPSTSPDSNATSTLTYSDKLSALPPSMASPNPNRGARSPMMNSQGQSPRIFRHSLDASRSWPSISQSGTNMDSFAGFSPALPDVDKGMSGKETRRPRVSASEGSLDHETSRRASMESDRTSLPTMQSVRQVLHRLRRGSDPTASSYAVPGDYTIKSDNLDAGSRSPSHSRSRAASPLRILQQWSQGIHHRPHTSHHEEPFIPVDPFQSHFLFSLRSSGSPRFRLPMWIRKRLPSKVNNTESLPMKANTHSHNTSAAHHSIDPHAEGNGIAFAAHVHKSDHVHSMDMHTIHIFFLDTLPRVIYLHLLLRIPWMYFSRVARIFEDAEVSKPDIQRMIDACGRGGSHFSQSQMNANSLGPGLTNTQTNPLNVPATNTDAANAGTSQKVRLPNNTLSPTGTGLGPTSATNLAAAAVASVVDLPLPLPEDWKSPLVSPSLIRFKLSWETFIDSLMREWKTLNVVSALLLSAILTMFQIEDAATDPLTRSAALLSLVCAIMSLSYGCIYIVRFGTMRSMYRASIWAEEAQKTKTLLWWNVWVLLGMPAVWMSWSMILFIVSILSFVWRTGAESDPHDRAPLSDRAALGPRIAITFVFFLGMLYFFLIVRTLQSYGSNNAGRGERTRVYIESQTRSREGTHRPHDTHGTTAIERIQELRTQHAKDRQRTPDHGRRSHTVDVVADVIRGRERDRRVLVKKGTPDASSRRQPLRRPIFGLGLGGAAGEGEGTDSEFDLEKGVTGHLDGNMELL